MSALQERYKSEVVPLLMKEFSYKSIMQAPKLVKVTVNIGLGEAVAEPKAMESAMKELSKITGQKPRITRAKRVP